VADIFISYSWKHHDLTRELGAALETHFGRGSVWWDQARVRAGDRFNPEITRALDEAKAVVVVWTEAAVSSDWVYAEALRAAVKRKIVTVCAADLDHNSIPLPFNIFNNCLVHDTGAIILAIESLRSGTPSPLPSALPGTGFRAFLLDPKQEALPLHAIATRPASLLLAKHRLVPFDDFHGIRAAFVDWAVGTPPHAMGRRALGRLVHAAAGLGKTRALIEIAEDLTGKHGWLAGFVPRDIRGAGRELAESALERLILGGGEAAGLMLIVDYAESRQGDVVWLAEKLLRRADTIAKPSRLVLLSRGSGVWWKELLLKNQSLQELCSLGGDRFDEYRIPEDIAVRDRRALFDASAHAFEAYQSAIAVPTGVPAPADALWHALETNSDYDRPLALQIAALLHVAGADPAGEQQKIAGLLERILGLEYDYWDKALKITGQPNWQQAIRNGVAQVTLLGGIGGAERSQALIERDPLFQQARDIDSPRVLDALTRLFPAENGGLVALEPDLVGEHHILTTLSDALVNSAMVFAGDDREHRQQIVTVLNRATRSEHGNLADRAVHQFRRLIAEQAAALGGDLIKVALETPGRLLDLCPALEGHLDKFDRDALREIDAALPLQSLALMDLSLAVAERRANALRELVASLDTASAMGDERREAILSGFAARVGTLGSRLSDLGRREEALAATQEAVDIRRRLAATRPDAFLPDLAMSLNNLGNRFSAVGRREEALAAALEAADIRRGLAATRPDAFLPNLAASLNNLGNAFSDLGRREAALAAAQEAADIYRRLAATRPDAVLPDLAKSLNNLGKMFSALGRREEALATAQEAADIYRRLAATRPDAFLPDLAMSLNNLGNGFSDLGRGEEALAAAQESADILRRLAQARPDAFLADLAMSLNNLGNTFSDLGRREEALAVAQEAVDIRRSLAKRRPDAFLPALATSLGALGRVLTALERHANATAVTHEGLGALAPFAERHPQVFEQLAAVLARDYLAACERSGAGPDVALLERVARALGWQGSQSG
jgi:tetratricopeptide (TPR) repeat protein